MHVPSEPSRKCSSWFVSSARVRWDNLHRQPLDDPPTTKQDLLERAGDQQIEYRKGQPVSLRQLIEDLEDEEFPSMANVVQGMHGALEEEGLSGPSTKEKAA